MHRPTSTAWCLSVGRATPGKVELRAEFTWSKPYSFATAHRRRWQAWGGGSLRATCSAGRSAACLGWEETWSGRVYLALLVVVGVMVGVVVVCAIVLVVVAVL